MKKLNATGALDVFLIPLIVVTILLVAAGSFAVWAYMSRQDYKYNTDQKVAAAVEVAKKQTSTAKDNEFAEKEKLPLKEYDGPAAFGSVVIKYPKTWGAYVNEQDRGSTPIDGYFHPVFVPGTTSKTSFALRVQVLGSDYTTALKSYESQIKIGKIKAAPYVPPKVQSVTGMRLEGEVAPRKQGYMVILPMRDKTLKIWTESSEFLNDFNNNILPNFTFEP